MIVKVEWKEHNRSYTIGIKRFLHELGIDVNDEKLIATTKKLLEQEEFNAESKDK